MWCILTPALHLDSNIYLNNKTIKHITEDTDTIGSVYCAFTEILLNIIQESEEKETVVASLGRRPVNADMATLSHFVFSQKPDSSPWPHLGSE